MRLASQRQSSSSVSTGLERDEEDACSRQCKPCRRTGGRTSLQRCCSDQFFCGPRRSMAQPHLAQSPLKCDACLRCISRPCCTRLTIPRSVAPFVAFPVQWSLGVTHQNDARSATAKSAQVGNRAIRVKTWKSPGNCGFFDDTCLPASDAGPQYSFVVTPATDAVSCL